MTTKELLEKLDLVERVKRLEYELVATRAQVVMLQDELDERDSARPKFGPLAKYAAAKLAKFARKLARRTA